MSTQPDGVSPESAPPTVVRDDSAVGGDEPGFARRMWRGTRGAGRAVWGLARRARDADGAAATGLHRLIDLHACACAGDALVAIALAGTVFFNVPVGEARLRVAMYLLITMAPFALLAPLVGPVLDRFRHGRRYALAVTMLTRAFFAWTIADNLDTWLLYPAAFGVLVMSKAYGVARSAAVPRLLPGKLTLVEANARGSLAGTIAASVAAPFGIALAQLGPEWTLRGAAVVFGLGVAVALRLPPRTDSQPPETVPRIFQLPGRKTSAKLFDPHVVAAVTATAALRALYGFLALFFAFRTREDDLGLPAAVALGLVVGALGVGSFASTAIGAKLKLGHPLRVHVWGVAIAAVATGVAALGYGLIAAVALAFLASATSGLCKLAVDAIIQRRLPENGRASAFAYSETILQLAWVLGGTLGLAPLSGQWGLAVAALGLTVATGRVVMLWNRIRLTRDAPTGGADQPSAPGAG